MQNANDACQQCVYRGQCELEEHDEVELCETVIEYEKVPKPTTQGENNNG